MQILIVINFAEGAKFLSLIVLKKNGIVLAMNTQTQLESQLYNASVEILIGVQDLD